MDEKLPGMLTGDQLIYEGVKSLTDSELTEEVLAAFEDFLTSKIPDGYVAYAMRWKWENKKRIGFYRLRMDPRYKEVKTENISYAINDRFLYLLIYLYPEVWVGFRVNCLGNKWIAHRMRHFSFNGGLK